MESNPSKGLTLPNAVNSSYTLTENRAHPGNA
jgi:hypothetical protein